MFYDDHNPLHFHARYNNAKALIRIADGEIILASCRRLHAARQRMGTSTAIGIGRKLATRATA
jgi:Domain of unknown function (DUF4160)